MEDVVDPQIALDNRRWNVLVADADDESLLSLEKAFEECNHKVTKCKDAEQCLEMFQEKKGKFDLVIIDVSMPNLIDGYELSRRIRKETDIPIILMSPAYSSADSVPKVLEYGACDFQLKPMDAFAVRNIDLETLRNLIRQEEEEQEASAPTSRDTGGQITSLDEVDVVNTCKTEKRSGDSITGLDPPARKKQRVIWSQDLHDKFVSAVTKFGLERAVPKKIMEVMNEPGLTRENVASHLQKYRQYHKKQLGDSQPKQKQVQQPKRKQEQEQCKSTDSIPDHHALKELYPESALAHTSALDEPSLPDGKGHGGFKIGCHQLPSWTDVAVQQPGFQGPFIDHRMSGYQNNMMVPEYETTYDPPISWRHQMHPNYKHFVDMYDMHSIDANNEMCYQPLPLQMVHHQSTSQLPNETDGSLLHHPTELDMLQYDTEFTGYEHSDGQMVGDADLQGNNTMCYSYGNIDSTFHQAEQLSFNATTLMRTSSFEPNIYQPDQQSSLNDIMLSSSYYDPTLYVDQLNQGGPGTDQMRQMNQESVDEELGFKGDPQDRRFHK